MAKNGNGRREFSTPPKDWRGGLLQLRWNLARAIAPRRAVHSRGLRFSVQCDNWITYYRWLTYNSKEPETLDWIDRSVRDGDVFFDIGANIGLYSVYAARRHPRLRVVAFEPEYSNLHLLRDNVVENEMKERVAVYSLALSNRAGIGRLHVQDLTPGAALHTESNEPMVQTLQDVPVVLSEGIGVTTIDLFCRETGLWPNCVKLDVDGTEPQVLEGGLEAFRSPGFRSLILEVRGPGMEERCGRFLREAGLRREWADPTGESSNEIWIR